MRRWLAALVLFLAALPAAPAQERFIEELGDVPLMEGFAVDADSVVDFDTPQGRIVRLSARGGAGPASVRRFYEAALPNLGWRPRGDGFVRETETLTLDIGRDGETTVVNFSLAPAAE